MAKMASHTSGEFTYKGRGQKVLKYARVSHGTSPEDLYGLMKDKWGLTLPTLLLSVTGGANDFVMKPRLKNIFSKGLVKAAETTGAWIITGGTHAGVMKHVGEAVRDCHSYAAREDFVVLGVVPWGVVYNADRLSSKEPVEYPADENDMGNLCCLDPYHTHFFLVDDGSHGKYGVEIALRTSLEKFISEKNEELHIKIPVVCVCLEGGKGSLDTVHQSMANNTPCVIVKGSGRIADVIAQAANRSASENTTSLIANKLRMLFKSFTENMIIQWTQKIHDIVANQQLLTIFSLDSDGTNDINEAIFQAFSKACGSISSENWKYHLTLAVCWNRLQLAKDIRSDWQKEAKELYPFMTLALIENKPNFVRLFLTQGVLLREYVTPDTLTRLYNIESSSVVCYKLEKFLKDELPPNLKDVLLDVSKICNRLSGQSRQTFQDTKDTKPPLSHKNPRLKRAAPADVRLLMNNSETPEHLIPELLVWAILQNRLSLTEVIWSKSRDCISGALACSMILCKSSKEEEDLKTSDEIMKLADHFEELAMGVLSECCKENEQQAEKLLTYESSVWGKSTCLQMAQNTRALNFMSHGGVQTLLTKVWWGKLSIDTGLTKVLLCMLCFPLIFTGLVSFRTETSSRNEKSKRSAMNGCQRLTAFFTAPVVVFYWNVIFYIGFLWLFARVLIMDFQVVPSWGECTIYVWVFTIFCEELRQSFYHPDGVGFGKKCKLYIGDFWNKVDVLALLLFLAGFICRFLRPTFYAGKVIFSLDFAIFCFRLIHIFAVSKVLGPKIIMIWQMLKDTFSFLFLLVLWIASFGVSKQAIMVHNEGRFNWILWNVVYKPYLTIFGDLPSDVYAHKLNVTECSLTGDDPTMSKCPIHDRSLNSLFPEWLTIILLCLYLLIANILLVNLLIAMFSYTFSEVQGSTDQVWRFQRHSLINEYCHRPPAPAPFIIFSHLYWLLKHVNRGSPSTESKPLKSRLEEHEKQSLLSWEADCRDEYLLNKRREKKQSTEQKTQDTYDKVEKVLKLLETEERLTVMEDQLSQVSGALNWITKSMAEKGFGAEDRPVLSGPRIRSDEDRSGGEECRRQRSKAE